MKKIFGYLLLSASLLSLGVVNKTNKDFEETTLLDNEDYVTLNHVRKANESNELAYSKMFSQVAYDEASESYFLRFATAVKGEINTIDYLRKVEGKDDYTKNSSVLYYGISASGETLYYDEVTQNASSDTSLRGDYYWTCYTIKFNKSSEFINKDISLTLKVNDIEIASKTTSLEKVKNMQTYTFEAEDADLVSMNGSAHVADATSASGGKYIDGMSGDTSGASLTFKIYAESDCVANLSVRSARHYSGERNFDNDCYKITLNGTSLTTGFVIKPNTNPDDRASIWTTFYDFNILNDIKLNKGENILVLNRAGLSLNLDAIKFDTYSKLVWEKDSEYKTYTFEAEDATIYSANGSVTIGNSNNASGGKYIDKMSSESNGASLTFNITAEKETNANIIVRSIKHPTSNRNFDDYYTISINNETIKSNLTIETTGTGSYDAWTTFYDFRLLENVSLLAGENTIVLTKCGSALNIDAIKIESTAALSFTNQSVYKLEAENATLGGNAKISAESNSNNPSGGKYVGGLSGSVGSMTFIINIETDCVVKFIMSYGNRTNDTSDRKFASKFSLTLNEESLTSDVVFNNGTENNYFGWEEYEICELNLKSGDNTIVLTSKGVTSSNVDYFKITSDAKVIFKKA